MDYSARVERTFSPCPKCQGLGFAGKILGESTQFCSTCQGAAVVLGLPEHELILSLPCYVDFRARRRSLSYRITFLALGSTFLVGIPYLIYIYILQLIGGLRRL